MAMQSHGTTYIYYWSVIICPGPNVVYSALRAPDMIQFKARLSSNGQSLTGTEMMSWNILGVSSVNRVQPGKPLRTTRPNPDIQTALTEWLVSVIR